MKKIIDFKGFYDRIIIDERINTTHVSMFFALFQFWKNDHSTDKIRIVREEVMKASKIRSIATYHKCIKDMHDWGYIFYEPSYNPFIGSLVTFTEKVLDVSKKHTPLINEQYHFGTSAEFRPPNFFEVEVYFLENESSIEEAAKFYNYYESNAWLVSGNSKMKSWNSAARTWLYKIKKRDKQP